MHRLDRSAADWLSTAQLKIYDSIEFGPGLVVAEAAAGAGKTHTLSYLVIKALMADGIQNVFIMTATRRVASRRTRRSLACASCTRIWAI